MNNAPMVPHALRLLLAKRLREARSRSGLTVEVAARSAGLTVEGLKAVELGCVLTHATVIERLARRYGVEVSWLVSPNPEA